MSVLWNYFWPVFTAGMILGGIAGTIAFRRRKRIVITLAAGIVATLIAAALWHGPLGAAHRFSVKVERDLGSVLRYYEMTQVTAHLHRDPLTRRVILSGPADDFQRSELVRLIDQLPGVGSARWSAGGSGVPLIAEAGLLSLVGFLLGVLLAYLVELRRRYNAQWNW